MMRALFLLPVLLLFALSYCSVNAPETAGSFTIVHGTSFGMCAGYCNSVMEIDGMTARLTQTSRDSIRYPPTTRTLQLTEAESRRLLELANVEQLTSVAGVHGCPDCADGGAEWVAIQTPERTIQATYEYESDLEPIAELQAQLRSIRQRFQ